MSFFRTAVATVTVTIVFSSVALAIQPGKTVSWNTPMGKVTFSGSNHAAMQVGCLECHSKIFKMKKGSTEMTMADITAGKFCGKCHRKGGRAFEPEGNCDICHKK